MKEYLSTGTYSTTIGRLNLTFSHNGFRDDDSRNGTYLHSDPDRAGG